MIYAGKAHPNDTEGKGLIRQIHEYANVLKDEINVVYLGKLQHGHRSKTYLRR